MDKRTRTLLLASVALIAVVGLGLIVLLWQTPGTVRITVTALPDDSTITLDGKSIKSGRQDLPKGTHTFKANRQYFDEVTKVVDTNDLKNGQTVYLLPGVSSKEAIQWLNDHPDVQKQREAAAGAVVSQDQATTLQKYPYIGQFPYEAIDFRVDYGYTNKGLLALTVTLQPYSDPQNAPDDYQQQLKDYKAEALDYLKSIKVDFNTVTLTWLPQDPDKK